jgi:hypothetical protein
MKQTENHNEPKEFYEKSNPEEVNMCEHSFERISTTRIQCRKCHLGFFDNPFSPFPVEEINKQIAKERASNNYYKRKHKKDVENTE